MEKPNGWPYSERRWDHVRRQEVARMTKAELIRELYTDGLTGIPNRRAYEDSQKRDIQVLLDVDSLKWVNDNLGHSAGDALLQTVGAVLGSCGVECYRIGGDEFAAQFDEPADVVKKLVTAQRLLQSAMFTFADAAGHTRTFQGIDLSYGTGATKELAEVRLMKQKAIREKIGLRASRGVRPARLLEVNKSDQPTVSSTLAA